MRAADASTPTAVMDVSNLLWTFSRPRAGIEPRYERLIPVTLALRSGGIREVVGVADANVRSLVDGQQPPPDLFDRFEVVAPGSRADNVILELAHTTPAWVVSNDKFRAEKRRNGWAKRNVHRVVITALPDDSGGGVTLGGAWNLALATMHDDPGDRP